MKRIIFLLLCFMLIFAMPIVASAEEAEPTTEETEVAEETAVAEETTTESIVGYVTEHIEEIAVICSLFAAAFYDRISRSKLNGSVGTLNNNAIAIAQNSTLAIDTALGNVKEIAETVQGYKEEFTTLLAEMRKTIEEKQSLEEMLTQVDAHLKTAKLANMEFANELADLLCLSNIPNSKKEELFSRHRAAVASIEVAEEVKADDSAEA